MNDHPEKPQTIAIIGSGLSSHYVIGSLYKTLHSSHRLPLPLVIDIFELGDQLGAGAIAWNKKNLNPFHLINVYNNREELIQKRNILDANIKPSIIDESLPLFSRFGEVRRDINGAILNFAFKLNILALQKAGVVVNIHLNTNVNGLDKTETGYSLRVGNGRAMQADFVVLGSGHWQGKSGINENPGVFASPWPASELEKKAELNSAIAVMGTNLSAIDAALTLANAAGTFEPIKAGWFKRAPKEGRLTFHPKPENPNFKLVMYSPLGTLPSVLGSVDVKENVINEKQFKEIIDSENVSLDALFTIFRHAFVSRYENDLSFKSDKNFQLLLAALKDETLDLDALVKILKHHIQSQSISDYVTHQHDAALESLNTQTPIPVQSFIRVTAGILDSKFNQFSAEDQERFMRDIRPVFTKLAYGMVISNAKQIQALVEGGFLEVKALGEHFSLGTIDQDGQTLPGAQVRYTDASGNHKTEYHRSVVKAYGDEPNRLRYSSPLMRNIYGNGLGTEALALYENQALGAKSFDQERASGIAGNTRFINGKYYRSSGTLAINEDFEVQPKGTDDEKPSNLFALGPLVTGSKPLLHGSFWIEYGAHNISATILERIKERAAQNTVIDKDIALMMIDPVSQGLIIFINPSMPPEKRELLSSKLIDDMQIDRNRIAFADINSLPVGLRTQMLRDSRDNRSR